MEAILSFGRWDDSVFGMAIDNDLEYAQRDEEFFYTYDGVDYKATHAEIGYLVAKWIADNLFIDMEFKGLHYAKDYFTGELDGFIMQMDTKAEKALDDYLRKWKLWDEYERRLAEGVKPEEGYMPFYTSIHAVPETIRVAVKLEILFEKEESFIDQYVMENLEAVFTPLTKHNKPLSFFSGTGEPVIGADYQGGTYCWKCFPLNSDDELPDTFSYSVVYDEEALEGYWCSVCGGDIV
jgi:hypothetical protein